MDALSPLLLALPVATALLLAASARLPSLVSTLLAAYLAFVAELALVTWALSPFHAVTRTGIAAACTALLAGAAAFWWRRGRPLPSLEAARHAVGELVHHRVALLFAAAVALVLAYELLLVLTAPANNWDSLTYHLARAASWAQEGGIHWIANAPSDRLNEFQPLAEQQILFLFVAAGSDGLFALPQYLAQLAILVAVYGAARRLGFAVPAAACSAFLLATFCVVALESTTAQNDLVAASFPVVAACLVLGGRPLELTLAGVALSLGIGTKLTTALVWPVLALLVWRRGPGAVARVALGAAAAFAAVGCWGFVLNLVHTGHLLGHGGGRVEVQGSPSFPDSLEVGLRLVFRLLDLAALSNWTIAALAAAGIAAGIAVAAWRRTASRRALLDAAAVAAPFLAPAAVAGAAVLLAIVTRKAQLPVEVEGSAEGGVNRGANEDYAAFGPLGVVALTVAWVAAALAYRARRASLDHLGLALALPLFLVLLSLVSVSNLFLNRFLIVPAVLTAPLLARLFVNRAATAAILAVAALTVALTQVHSDTKALDGEAGRPWSLTQADAVKQTFLPDAGWALEAFEQEVPPRACVGAVLGDGEPSYLLWGRNLDRRITYLPVQDALNEAYRHDLFHVVVSTGPNRWAVDRLAAAGWKVEPLSEYWQLAVAPGTAASACGDGSRG